MIFVCHPFHCSWCPLSPLISHHVHLVLTGRMRQMKTECKHKTGAPLCPVSGGNPAALLPPCLWGRGSHGNRVPGLSLLWPGSERRQLCPGTQCSRYSHLTSSFVHITRTSQREHVPNEGFMELSGYPCPHLSLPHLRLTPMLLDFLKAFLFTSCSSEVILNLVCEELAMIHGSPPP